MTVPGRGFPVKSPWGRKGLGTKNLKKKNQCSWSKVSKERRTQGMTVETLWAVMPNWDFILRTTRNFQQRNGMTQVILYGDHCRLCQKRLEKWSLLQSSMPETAIPWTKTWQPNFSAVDRFRYISEVEPTKVTGGLHMGMMARKESEMMPITWASSPFIRRVFFRRYNDRPMQESGLWAMVCL